MKSGVVFLNPEMLYLGIAASVLVGIAFFFERRSRRKLLEKFASARLLPQISRTTSNAKEIFKGILFTLGVFFIFAALARPQWGYRWEESKTRGIDLIFAIDTSKSMLAEDVKPDRLERAKLAVLDISSKLGGDRIGLVAFSGQSFLQCPLTLDYDAFRMSLEAIDTNIIQRGGTNIAAAISEAESAFSDTSNRKVVVLISDGEELEASAIEKAKQAAKDGVTIYALGVGGASGEPIPIRAPNGSVEYLKDENGKLVSSKLNEKVLAEIAEATGGFYSKLSAAAISDICDALKKIPQQEMSSRMRQLAIERFQIPLGIAIVLLSLAALVGNRKFFIPRTGSSIFPLALIALLAGFSAGNLRAQTEKPPLEQPGEQKIQSSETSEEKIDSPEKASELSQIEKTRALFNEGIDSYNAGEYEKSISLLDEAMRNSDDVEIHSKSFHNIGNSLYKMTERALSECETPQEAKQRADQISQGASQTLIGGTELLREGLNRLAKENEMLSKASKEGKILSEEEKKALMQKSPLKEESFQQTLKQQISQMEQMEKSAKDFSEKNGSSNWDKAKKSISDSVKNFGNALEITPDFPRASKNLKIASGVEKKIKEDASDYESAVKSLESPSEKKKFERMALLKEELKKLVRDDQNQNNQQNDNQDNQQQDQQQNQQNQQQDQQQNQQQNQQNQQQNQQQDQQQNQENQQDQEQNQQQNQDKQEQKQEQQNQEQNRDDKQNGQDEKKDKEEKKGDDKNSRDGQKDTQDKSGGEDKQSQEDRNRDGKDGRNEDEKDKSGPQEKQEEQKFDEGNERQKTAQDISDKKDEQAVENKNAQPAGEVSEEKKEEQSPGYARGEEDENFRKAEGFMTRREAKELLESMHDSEKRLPMSGFGEQRNRYEQNYKDW